MAGRNSYGKRSHSQSDHHENGGNKRRNYPSEDRERFVIDREDTVYRYLCPVKKIGSIMGRGGDIIKQLRLDTKAKIRIGETVPGSEERVVTIYSRSEESNESEDGEGHILPAQDALFRVHERVVAEESHSDEDAEGGRHVTARLLVPSDQVGCIIGKGGQTVQNMRSDTGTQIHIFKEDRLPTCALGSDELVQITGDAQAVKKALQQIASRLRDNPSRSQHLLTSAMANLYPPPPGRSLVGPGSGPPIVGLPPMMGHYGGYKGEAGDWSRSMYSAPRDEGSSKEFSLRFVCPTGNIGGVIGKGGTIINQIRQESGAAIKVDSSSASEGDDCLIVVSAKEFFENSFSPALDAALRLQPRCSDVVERDSGIVSFTTRILVPTSRIGCLIGKGGAIVTEMRRATKANIRILSKENDTLPKIAAEDDDMVQISGDPEVAKEALIHVVTRLKANLFDREGSVSSLHPGLPYLPLPSEGSDAYYGNRDSNRYGRGYGGSGDAPSDGYGSYSGSQMGGSGGAYGVYGGAYSSGRSGSGMSSQNPSSRRRNYGY